MISLGIEAPSRKDEKSRFRLLRGEGRLDISFYDEGAVLALRGSTVGEKSFALGKCAGGFVDDMHMGLHAAFGE